MVRVLWPNINGISSEQRKTCCNIHVLKSMEFYENMVFYLDIYAQVFILTLLFFFSVQNGIRA